MTTQQHTVATDVLNRWVAFMDKEHYADNAEVNWTEHGTTFAVIKDWLTAVNAHDALVEALEAILVAEFGPKWDTLIAGHAGLTATYWGRARAALRLAGGG